MAIPYPSASTAQHLVAPTAAGLPSSQVESALVQVAEASREVMSLVHDLSVRLQPVCLPPSVAGESVGPKVPECSPLVSQLRERADFLRGTAAELRSLLDRLEV